MATHSRVLAWRSSHGGAWWATVHGGHKMFSYNPVWNSELDMDLFCPVSQMANPRFSTVQGHGQGHAKSG